MYKELRDIWERKNEVTSREYFSLLPKICLTKYERFVIKEKK